MNRKIKFRGKRYDNKKWHYGNYLYLKNVPSYDWTGTERVNHEDVHFMNCIWKQQERGKNGENNATS